MNRSLAECVYWIMRVDALHEKVRYDRHVVTTAIALVCGVDEHGHRQDMVIEYMLEKSKEAYFRQFRSLQEPRDNTPAKSYLTLIPGL